MAVDGKGWARWRSAWACGLLSFGLLAAWSAHAAQTQRQSAPVVKAAKAQKPTSTGKQRAASTDKSKREKNLARNKTNPKGSALAARKPQRSGQAAAAKRSTGSPSARALTQRDTKKRVVQRSGGASSQRAASALVRANRQQASYIAQATSRSAGEIMGLREADDPLDLSSSVALVVDQETREVLFSKNDTAVLPIASLTKLMTGLVIADAQLSLDELITITDADAAVYRNSRLSVGTTLPRGKMMHLALMSSENRAANALGRTFPGGRDAFVDRMNAKAVELGMMDTRFVEPTGLSSDNRSSARDLATLVSVAYDRPILRDLSTSPGYQLDLGRRVLQYNNSNGLVRNPEWEIGLQKTGYISAAGRCLVMQARVAGRKLIMVFLDSAGKLARVQDAERVRRWLEAQSIQQQFMRPQG